MLKYIAKFINTVFVRNIIFFPLRIYAENSKYDFYMFM